MRQLVRNGLTITAFANSLHKTGSSSCNSSIQETPQTLFVKESITIKNSRRLKPTLDEYLRRKTGIS